MRPGQAQRRHRGRGRPPPMCDAPLTNPSLSHIPTRLPSPRCLLTANGQIICTTHRKANVWLMPHCVHTTIQIPHILLTIMLALYVARNPLYTRRSVKCYTVVLWLTSYFLSWAVAWLIFLALRWVKIWVRSKFQIYHPYSGVRSKLRIYHPLSRHSKHLHLTHSSHDLTRAEWTTSTSPKQNKLVSQGTSVQKICFSVRDTNKMIHLCIYITYFADICY